MMKVTRNVFTISDLVKWMDEKNLVVNRDYQRSGGLWPANARSYFIDTILSGYPFPKVTIRQMINLKTKKMVREIIDGQQRLTTIYDFVKNKMPLTAVSKNYNQQRFDDLDETEQEEFLGYEVSVDTLTTATVEETLEVFRRMNSYTVPLNEQEKRHATYQGDFKWFIKDMIDLYSPMFEKYHILTVTQISRMLDADLMTELCQILIQGVQTRANKKLDDLYKLNDRKFVNRESIEKQLIEVLDTIKVTFKPLADQEILTGFSLYSLFSALVYNKYGIVGVKPEKVGGLKPIKKYSIDFEKAIQNIADLSRAVEIKDFSGPYEEFVKASTSSTHRINNRLIRLKWYVAALQDRMLDDAILPSKNV